MVEPSALERMTHICQKVCAFWGSAELNRYISRLVMDSRGGQRQGLPMAVAADLFFLALLNKTLRALALAESKKISAEEAFQHVDEWDQEQLTEDLFDNPLDDSPDGPTKPLDMIARQARQHVHMNVVPDVEIPSSKTTLIQFFINLVTHRLFLLIIVILLLLNVMPALLDR